MDPSKRYLYVYEFMDNHAYVGLTGDMHQRDAQHRRTGAVYEHSIKTGEQIPEPEILTEALDAAQAAEFEAYYIHAYMANDWMILNRNRGGSLGRGVRITFDKDACIAAAKTCSTRVELKRKNRFVYNAIYKNGWKHEAFAHMKQFTR